MNHKDQSLSGQFYMMIAITFCLFEANGDGGKLSYCFVVPLWFCLGNAKTLSGLHNKISWLHYGLTLKIHPFTTLTLASIKFLEESP